MIFNGNSGRTVVLISLVFILSTEVFQITTDKDYQRNPAIYGDIVVWEEEEFYGALPIRNIYGYNLSEMEEFQITKSRYYDIYPAIYGDIVVWVRFEYDDNWNICGYNLSTKKEFQITINSDREVIPAIYGDIVVWTDDRNGNEDIYGYNITTKEVFQITYDESDQYSPAIHGDIVVWTDDRNGKYNSDEYNADIYGYNLSTGQEFQITYDESDQYSPAIHGDIVVWTDNRNGKYNRDIYTYNLSTGQEFQITYDESDQRWPEVYGDIVVWTDNRNGNYDIYGYFFPENQIFQITEDEDSQESPAIYYNFVVWEDWRGKNSDIYGYDFFGMHYERMPPPVYENNSSSKRIACEEWGVFIVEVVTPLFLSMHFLFDYFTKKRRVSLAWGTGFLLHSILSMFFMIDVIFWINFDISSILPVYVYLMIFMPIIVGIVIALEMASFYYGISLLFLCKRSFFREKMSVLIMLLYSILAYYFVSIFFYYYRDIVRLAYFTQDVLIIPISLLIAVLFYHIYRKTDSDDSFKQVSLFISVAWFLLTISSMFIIPLVYGEVFGRLPLIFDNDIYVIIMWVLESIAWIFMIYGMVIQKAITSAWKKRIAKAAVMTWKKKNEI